MTNPYSEDLRERALARADAGETVRSIGEALQISPSCISKWKKLRRETGSLRPGKMTATRSEPCPAPMPIGCGSASALDHSRCGS